MQLQRDACDYRSCGELIRDFLIARPRLASYKGSIVGKMVVTLTHAPVSPRGSAWNFGSPRWSCLGGGSFRGADRGGASTGSFLSLKR
jgi:hypothetical protein